MTLGSTLVVVVALGSVFREVITSYFRKFLRGKKLMILELKATFSEYQMSFLTPRLRFTECFLTDILAVRKKCCV